MMVGQIALLPALALARGAFTRIPGISKSQAQCDLTARVFGSAMWPDGAPAVPPANVIMATAEDCLDQEIVPRLVAGGAALERVLFIRRIRQDDGTERALLLGEDIPELERNNVEVGEVGPVTIDPITAYMGGVGRATNVRDQLASPQYLVERMNVNLSTVTLTSKSRSNRGIDQFIGSRAFIAACRIGHVAIEKVIDGKATGRILFANPKNNPHSKMPTLAYRIVPTAVDQTIASSHIVWEADPVDITADEALAAAAGRRGEGGGDVTAKDEPLEFLDKVLADGPMLVKEVQHQAVDASLLRSATPIGDSKPFRAVRQFLGVVTIKAEIADGWVWAPKAPSDTEDAVENAGRLRG
jgi:hypothetical protein